MFLSYICIKMAARTIISYEFPVLCCPACRHSPPACTPLHTWSNWSYPHIGSSRDMVFKSLCHEIKTFYFLCFAIFFHESTCIYVHI